MARQAHSGMTFWVDPRQDHSGMTNGVGLTRACHSRDLLAGIQYRFVIPRLDRGIQEKKHLTMFQMWYI
jgi:hypothetical protein